MNDQSRVSILAASMALLFSAGSALASGSHDDGHGTDSAHVVEIGQPADSADADRSVSLTANDAMQFVPRDIDVKAGETVRFVIRNTGDLPHSFTLGTPAGQEEHEASMQGMAAEKMADHMQDDPTGIVVQPGETGEITWRFAGDRPLEFACHIPGHYSAGMKGRVEVEPSEELAELPARGT